MGSSRLVAFLAAASGTGNDPGTAAGIVIIVGVVVAAAALFAILWWAGNRVLRRWRKPIGEAPEEHEPGQVGRI
jgi:membrane protein DedA with SNARE-associated domain